MKIKFYTKSISALLIASLTSIPTFAIKPTKMPGFASDMFMKMHKSLDEEAKLVELDNYMQDICRRIFHPNNTNPMVKWARQNSKPEDVNKTIYQIWASGVNRTESNIGNDPALGKNFYVLPEFLRKAAKENSSAQTDRYLRFATELLYREHKAHKLKIMILYEQELRKKVDDLLHQGDCWYSFDQPGMEFWSEKVIKELIGNRLVTFREIIDILSLTAERNDFFGNCIIGACIAFKKCEELGLPCEIAVKSGHYGVIVNSNGKRYIINYPAGVLNIAANGVIHKNIIQEINDEEYTTWTILHLNMLRMMR